MAGSDFFRFVDEFLAGEGYHAHMARENIADGHSLRESLAAVKLSGCASDGCCAKTYVEQVLNELKNIPQWTVKEARSALEVAGFEPRDFKF